MKITFILVGKVKEDFLKKAYLEYQKRLSKYAIINIEYVEEEKINNPSLINKGLEEEGKRILSIIKDNSFVYLIDLRGKELDSIEFAKNLEKNISISNNQLYFVVGSSYGLGENIRKRANFAISLGKLTTTHPLALLLTLEQVYRAFKINNKEIYHK